MVSHSMNLLKSYCDIAIYIGRDNHITVYKDVKHAIENYIFDESINTIV